MFPSARKQRLVSEARLDGAGFRGCGRRREVMETLAYASYGANVIPMHTRMHTRVLAHTPEPTRCHGCTCTLFIPSVWHTREPHVHHLLQCIQMLQAEFTLRIVDRRGLYRRGDLEGEKRAILLRRVVQGQEFLSCNLISSVI